MPHIKQAERPFLDYTGEFTQEVAKSILSMSERNMDSLGEAAWLKRKVFNVMVECLQNIIKHSSDSKETKAELYTAFFKIGKTQNQFIIVTGNRVENTNVDALETKINQVNSLSKTGLRALYKEIITTGSLSDVGGAGLGFIDIVRKSGSTLVYNIEKIDEHISFYTLSINIDPTKSKHHHDEESEIERHKELR